MGTIQTIGTMMWSRTSKLSWRRQAQRGSLSTIRKSLRSSCRNCLAIVPTPSTHLTPSSGDSTIAHHPYHHTLQLLIWRDTGHAIQFSSARGALVKSQGGPPPRTFAAQQSLTKGHASLSV